jgi:Pyruvate-formate lyase
MTEAGKLHKQAFELRRKSHVHIEATDFYLQEYLKYIDNTPELREAKALLNLWRNCTIKVYPDETLVGRILYNEPVGFHYGCGTYINHGVDEDTANLIRQRKYVNLYEPIFFERYPDLLNDELIEACYNTSAGSSFFGGHMVMHHAKLLEIGLNGYGELINQYNDGSEYYEALSTILEAFRTVILRTADECDNELADDLKYIAYHKPNSFRQAIQLIWFVHICADCDSFGRTDQYLYPFYKSDIESGKITYEEALSLIEGLVIKVEEVGAIQNMTIGGEYNDITLMIMRSTREVMYKGPNLCLRINDTMPDIYKDEIIKSLGTGQALPALYNDNQYIPHLIRYGIPESDAVNYCLAGCSQVMIPGKTQFVNDIGMMNIAKIFELTMNEFDDCGNYDEFYNKFIAKIKHSSNLEADLNNIDIRIRGNTEGYIFRSLLTDGCIESGIGCYRGGAVYNGVQLECIGITNAADSLMGLKRTVFDDKIVNFATLKSALADDFNGYEKLQRYLLTQVPKYGNGNNEVDNIRTEITKILFDALTSQKGELGGHYIPGEVIFVAHDGMGQNVAATPDGRNKSKPLADSAGASQGFDINGPTALINSLLTNVNRHLVTTIAVNVKFAKSMWDTNSDKIYALFDSYFKSGGQQLQVNVNDNAILEKAYNDPDNYRNLIIRVGGYSDYYVNLSRNLQREIIERSSHVL